MFMSIFGFLVNSTSRLSHFFLSILSSALFNRSNRISRGVRTSRRAMNEAQLLSYAAHDCSVMITGGTGHSAVRERLVAQLAFQSQQAYGPVIILHRGNGELERHVAGLPGAILCGRGQRNYDPFRDLSPGAIADVLLDNIPSGSPFILNIPQAKIYVQGLAQLYLQCRGRRPSLNSLCDCTDITSKGYSRIINELQNLLNQGQIPQNTYDDIKAQLDAGQSQELALHAYLSATLQQLSSCAPPMRMGLPDPQYISLRRAISRGGILCVDVGSVSDEQIFYNLFVNELIRCDIDGLGRPYLILDGVNIKASPALSSLLEGQNAPVHCICCENVYAALNDGKPGAPLFNSLASGCGMHITLRQPSGAAANLWSEYYGTYQKQKRSLGYNQGRATGHGTQLFPGYSHGQMVQYTDVDERIWRPDAFTKMSDLACIFVIRNGGSTKYMQTRITPQ